MVFGPFGPRAIPLYPSLVTFLDYLPSVDKAPPSAKHKAEKGIFRALLISALNQFLVDASYPDDRRIHTTSDGRYFAQSWEEWEWYLPMFSAADIERGFEELIMAGYVARLGATPGGYVPLGIEHRKLELDMAGDES